MNQDLYSTYEAFVAALPALIAIALIAALRLRGNASACRDRARFIAITGLFDRMGERFRSGRGSGAGPGGLKGWPFLPRMPSERWFCAVRPVAPGTRVGASLQVFRDAEYDRPPDSARAPALPRRDRTVTRTAWRWSGPASPCEAGR